MTRPIDNSAKFFTWFAALCWGIVAVSAAAMALGQEDAINPVIGVTPPALFLTFAAIILRRQDRRP